MKMRTITISLVLLSLSLIHASCSSEGTKDGKTKEADRGAALAKDSLVSKHFTEKEIVNLELILEFFDNLLMDHYNTPDAAKAYSLFMKEQAAAKNMDELYRQADMTKKDELLELLRKVDEVTFYNIWMDNTYQHPESGEILFILGLNPKGNYKTFVEDLARIEEELNSYQVILFIDQRVTAENAHEFAKAAHKLDYSKRSYRLLVAVHYISLLAEKHGIGSHML